MVSLILLLYFLIISYIKTGPVLKSGCSLDLDNPSDWPDKPPILADKFGSLVLPSGDQDHRYFDIGGEKIVLLGCPETTFELWPKEDLLYAQCLGKDRWLLMSESGSVWEEGNSLGNYSCHRRPDESVSIVGTCGPGNIGTKIRVQFDILEDVDGEAVTITVCHNMKRANTLWTKHNLWDEISASDHGNKRPKFKTDGFYDFDVNNCYKKDTQHDTIASLVGSESLADQYIQSYNTNLFLSRGHLAPNSDFLFYTWMDATFHYINAAPQWQSFNGGNWKYLEENCRRFVMERKLDLVVYTGTHGVLELEDVNGNMVDIYLHGDQLPVPRFYWKILHDIKTNSGVALIGINNPHLQSVPERYIICPPLANHTLIEDINDPTDIKKGFVWVCRVGDLAVTVPEIPKLPSMSLLE